MIDITNELAYFPKQFQHFRQIFYINIAQNFYLISPELWLIVCSLLLKTVIKQKMKSLIILYLFISYSLVCADMKSREAREVSPENEGESPDWQCDDPCNGLHFSLINNKLFDLRLNPINHLINFV